MSSFLDSSILVGAVYEDEPFHTECRFLVESGKFAIFSHSLLEVFSTLTGGSKGRLRIPSDIAAEILRTSVIPFASQVIHLDTAEILEALATARRHGVRGGAVYDYMHLVAARKAGAQQIYTLNTSDFDALRKESDPTIEKP